MSNSRVREKGIAKQEIEVASTVESKVSGLRDRSSRTWWAVDLLKLTALYVNEEYKHKEKGKPWRPRDYPTGNTANAPTEKYVLAALRVASHEKFKEYKVDFLAVYVGKDAHPMTVERMTEFEMMLDASLDKEPFTIERSVGRYDVAEDALDALIPISECARALPVHRSTLHRWLDEGLRAEMVGVYPAVQKKGAYYFINYLAALKWKHEHQGGQGKGKGR